MMNWTEEKIKEVYEEVMRAAVTDEEFRTALLGNPTAAIEKLTGEKLPEGFKLKVLEEDPDYDMTILLPPMLGDELSDEDMEQVAGGGVISSILISVASGAIDDALRQNGGKK